ncbi:hypothetical protein PT974_05642 [Cladobotryum mycophilum]|uniref:Uncharacterized protein n=1 Tax=Cladobotryum mycophilum TaxID=491253 RepID=A0ABR0SKL6_9HYPO
MDEDQDGGLLNIDFSDVEEDDTKKRADRTGQTEAHFQAVKRDYSAKVENGNIYKSVDLSLGPNANKIHIYEFLHAVEELYFFRQYQHAIDLVHEITAASVGNKGLDEETRQLLSVYESKCKQKLGNA